ncbi:MAG: CusA/CzcA family heavy metal efflux RND transporter [Hyphomicrobium sp.]|uniref:efflux RND transporter permease subunit n=1 Tax=Hyphomicrobium sp. TaxID=82 RepID=UPI001325C0F6|nr:CusA/CzcA family heavy metal efflux RND transporter [Hyphomicrobium sp.]KAB2943528.1 MAG: CusA/CzcA family heavy metal efflux RND transporter [Hyphomicrobium sp.]MBZ0209761.1 CusA/CzcA family heavy metal efflux RND transporter [Hyphomicrobium sp.]
MIEKILNFSVAQRFLVVLAVAAVAAFGIKSLSQLPIDAVPDITNNQVQINTEVPGLSPFEIEKNVTYPIETALAGIPGLSYTRSLSRNGFSQVVAVFDDNVDIYFARTQVAERLAQAKGNLPVGAEPRMGAVSTGLGEIYMWTVHYKHPNGKGAEIRDGQPGWQSDGSYLTPEGVHLRKDFELATYLRTVEDWIIRPQLKGVLGVAEVDAIGGFEQQYQVQPDPEKLLSYGLSFPDVIAALERNNTSVGAGYLEQRGESYVVRADGRLETIKDIGNVIVANKNGIPVYLKDVADVGIGRELRTGSASENGDEVVVGTAMMLKGGNSRTVSHAVDAKITEINKSLPPDIGIQTVLNRTLLVDATIKTVAKNLAEGALLVIVVLFLMLGNLRASLITALVIPITMLMTIIGMVHTGISANLMSLGALDFGLIVDGAVIITENAIRKLAERQHHEGRLLRLDERMHEVMVASKEMIQPTVFGQIIIITVYLPLLTFTGVEGKMFEPMALTVIIALLCAFVLSLTFVPAMIAIFISGKVEEKENLVIRVAKARYAPMLRAGLADTGFVILVAIGFFAISMFLFTRLGQEFIPTLDEKNLAMHAMRIPSTSLSQSTDMQLQVETAVKKFPEVAFVFSKTGTAEMASDPMPPHVSDTFIMLKPQDEWPNPYETKAELIDRIAKAVGLLPGNNYEYTQPIQMRFNELIAGVRSDVAVKVFGDKFEQLGDTANKIAGVLRSVPGAADVKVEQTTGLPMLNVKLDKAAIARNGLNVGDVLDVISIAIGGRETGLVFEGDRRFDIIVRLPDNLREDLEALRNLPVALPSAAGGRPNFVPIKTLASFNIEEGPNQISRENGKRRVVVQANVRGRDIGSFVAEAQAKIDAQVKLPPGTWITWGGQFENLQAAQSRLLIVVPACFFVIFLMLFTALGNVREALLVFSGVPLAVSGGIFTLYFSGMPFSISAAVGFIALSGIAVLNGLVMVTYINQLLERGLPGEQAIFEGAMTRLRPVLMTALVASLGFVPMALATGTGAEVQKPLATVVIGGLITATLLTLIVLPALYKRYILVEEVALQPAAEGQPAE